MKTKWKKVILQQIVRIILLFCTFSICAVAADEATTHELCLVPLDPPGFVELTSYVSVVEFSCDATQCSLQVNQTYQLHNRDRIKEHVMRIGSPQQEGERLEAQNIYVRDGEGTALPPSEGNTFQSAAWEITLAPDERRGFVLSYIQPLFSEHFVHWRPDLSPLIAWGTIGSGRVEFKLPQYASDDIFVAVEPSDYAFDGRTVVWEYGKIERLAQHKAVLFSPTIWQRLQDLRRDEAHHDLARLYSTLQVAAQREGIPYADHSEEIAAELQAAIKDAPDNTSARLDLAAFYLESSEAKPDLRLNYLLLSAQELAAVQQYRPDDKQVANALSQAYYKAAQTANETGDPAGALVYLKKAAQVSNAQIPYEPEELEDLTLQWALDLAERGQVSEALIQTQDALSPQTRDALLHYAPPLVSVRTEVTLRPHMRTVRYELRLYPLLAARTWEQLQEIVQRLKTVDECLIGLETDTSEAHAATLEMQMPFSSVAELNEKCKAVRKALLEEEGMVSTFILQAWQTEIEAYEMETKPWEDRYRYQEKVNLTPTKTSWETKAQYTDWRLIELRNASPRSGRAQLEQRLALLALRHQRQIWDQLSSGSFWIYKVAFENEPQFPSSSWLLSWGETRDLHIDRPLYHWQFLLRASILLLGLALICGTLVHLGRKR